MAVDQSKCCVCRRLPKMPGQEACKICRRKIDQMNDKWAKRRGYTSYGAYLEEYRASRGR